MKNKYLAAVFALILIAFLTDCQKNRQWKGQIKVVNGITVVENPKLPLYEEPVLILEEELRVGDQESRSDYIFAKVSSLAVDSNLNIYAADDKEGHIKVFDSDGKYLRTISRSGQGPGEIGRPEKIFIDENSHLVVVDPRRREIHTFSTTGDHLGSSKFDSIYPMDTQRDSCGNFYVMNFIRPPGSKEGAYELLKLTTDLKKRKSLIRVDISADAKPSVFEDIPNFAVRFDDSLVLGYQAKYMFKIFNSEGNIVREIHQKSVPVPIPEKVKEEMRRRDAQSAIPLKMKIPKYYMPFWTFYLDEAGCMLVVKPERAEDGESQVCDVLSAEGKYLCRISLKVMDPIVLTITGGKLYVMDEDIDGNPILIRYSMKWLNM